MPLGCEDMYVEKDGTNYFRRIDGKDISELVKKVEAEWLPLAMLAAKLINQIRKVFKVSLLFVFLWHRRHNSF